MLIIPHKKFTRTINDIDKIYEPRRHIVIYIPNNIGSGQDRISIANSCIQNGYIGGIQSQSELLYSINLYYGIIENPITVMPNGQIEVNRGAIVRIGAYNYSYRLINTFNDISNTTNFYDGIFKQNYTTFKNKSSDGSNIIAPSDPRYYNIDHQIVVLDDDSAYFANTGDELGFDEIARHGGGIGYILNDFLDPNTTIKVAHVNIEDPYKLLKTNTELLEFVNSSICRIEQFSSYIFASSYTLIFDKELGYNIVELKRIFNKIDKKYEKLDVMKFFETVNYINTELQNSNFNIRLTIIYNEFQTHVSLLPLFEKNKITSIIDNIKMQEYMEDSYNAL